MGCVSIFAQIAARSAAEHAPPSARVMLPSSATPVSTIPESLVGRRRLVPHVGAAGVSSATRAARCETSACRAMEQNE